jgi:hypothetical protein
MALTLQGTLASTPVGSGATVQIVKATVHGKIALSTGTVNVVNDFYFSTGLAQPLNQAMSNAMCTATPGTSVFYKALARLHSSFTAPTVVWQSLTSPLAQYFTDTSTYVGGNAATGNRMPSFVAACVELGTATHMRNTQAKLYFSPLSIGDVTNDQFSTAGATAWQAVAAAGGVSLAIAGGGTLTPVIVTGIGKQSSYSRQSGSTAYIRNFNLANGITPLDTPIPDITGQIIYCPIVSANCSLDPWVTHAKDRVGHARRSFSRRGSGMGGS